MAVAGARARRLSFFVDTGCGKTLVSLVLCDFFASIGVIERALVLVPANVNLFEWQREIAKHTPHLSYCILDDDSSKAKWEKLEVSDALITIATYPGLVRMVCDQARIIKDNSKMLVPNAQAVHALADHFQALILDESTAVKNSESLPFRICRQFAKKAKVVFTLTATPHGRDPIDLWAQLNLVDGGETLGETLGLFRTVFFREVKGFRNRRQYKFIESKQTLLHRVLANRSLRFEADEADLPAVTEIIKTVTLPADTLTYVTRAMRAIHQSCGDPKIIKNSFLRLRQISSGFIGFKDDETGKRAQFEFPDNPKLDLLLTLLDSITHKAIVYYEFTHSAFKIAAELEKRGLSYVHLWGGTKEPQQILRQFDDPNTQIMLLQNRFGMGLNLQAARYCFFLNRRSVRSCASNVVAEWNANTHRINACSSMIWCVARRWTSRSLPGSNKATICSLLSLTGRCGCDSFQSFSFRRTAN